MYILEKENKQSSSYKMNIKSHSLDKPNPLLRFAIDENKIYSSRLLIRFLWKNDFSEKLFNTIKSSFRDPEEFMKDYEFDVASENELEIPIMMKKASTILEKKKFMATPFMKKWK